jgi:hypothetical protein
MESDLHFVLLGGFIWLFEVEIIVHCWKCLRA